MTYNIAPLIRFVDQVLASLPTRSQLGRPYLYSETAMLLFLLTMMIKHIYSFKEMAHYAKQHYQHFGFPKAPSRQTISRRFYRLP